MGIKLFDEWSIKVTKTFDLKFLNDCTIGVDAAYFLDKLSPDSLSLQLALGGSSPCLETKVAAWIHDLTAAGLKLHFVFNGLDSGVGSDLAANAARAAQINYEAFTAYEEKNAVLTNQTLRKGTPPPGDQVKLAFDKGLGVSDTTIVSEMLKKILHERNVPFTVAPYSALAQLVYFEAHPSQFIDAVYGPSELFCFGIDKVITRFKPEQALFDWIDRRDCLTELGNVPGHVFIDALMLAGSSLLQKFPPFSSQTIQPSLRSIVHSISNAGGSVARLCAQYPTDPNTKAYLDLYKRAMTRVKHHVVITAEGDVEALDKEHAPDDVHECIGLRLPEELYMYLSRGMLRPRVLNWLASAKINIMQPLAGGDARQYQGLAKSQLEPMRKQALSLLTEPIHRYFHTRDIVTKLWFDPSYEGKFNMKDQPSIRDQLSKWHVRNAQIEDFSGFGMPPGSLSFALLTLSNVDFAGKTVTPKPKAGYEPLKLPNEILANVVWRFLQLRGFVNEQHQLTEWGKILETALESAGTENHQEEAVFLAIELLRLELISPDTMFLGYAGAPVNGSENDKASTMMVSRVACFGKICHNPKTYSGTLSRHLLAYQSMISNVQASLRDLIEMILVAMFLEGSIDRDRDDWMGLSLGLPFFEQHSCAMGALTMCYLDYLQAEPDPTSERVREELKTKCQEWFLNSDTRDSLNDAYRIWDSVYKGVKAAGDKVKIRKQWDETNEWLSARR